MGLNPKPMKADIHAPNTTCFYLDNGETLILLRSYEWQIIYFTPSCSIFHHEFPRSLLRRRPKNSSDGEKNYLYQR
jgi:hypothetical protein